MHNIWVDMHIFLKQDIHRNWTSFTHIIIIYLFIYLFIYLLFIYLFIIYLFIYLFFYM